MCHMKAYDKALSLLAVREHTAKEIREKLLKRGYGDDEVDEAISHLLEEGAIDDARYVESYVRSRIRKGGESDSPPMKPIRELIRQYRRLPA